MYIHLDDSVNKIKRSETLMKMNSIYNYTLRERENAKLRQDKANIIYNSAFAISCMALTIIILILWIRYKRQQQNLMRLKIEKLEDLRHQLKEKAEEKNESECFSIENSQIYKNIRRILNSPDENKGLNDHQWQQVSELVESLYPDFRKRLSEICKMNHNELHVSLLLKLRLLPSEIALLTNHSKESVSATRRRLFEKAFGTKGSPKDWDEFINSL